MEKKKTKKILKTVWHFLPLIVISIIGYLAVTGQLQDVMERFGSHHDISDREDDEIISEVNDLNIPQGRIVLRDYFDQWELAPLVKEYNPDNKVKRLDAYGITKMEVQHLNAILKEQQIYTYEHPLSSEYESDPEKGVSIINPDNIRSIGEEFDIRSYFLKCRVDKIEIHKDLTWLKSVDERRFFQQGAKEIIMKRMDSDNHILSGKKSDFYSGKNMILVTVDVTFECSSPYPVMFKPGESITYLAREEDKLLIKSAEPAYRIYKDDDSDECIMCGHNALLNTNEFYDNTDGSDSPNFIGDFYYMRDGEKEQFTVAYLIPENMLDYAYIGYDPQCVTVREDCYNAIDLHLVKLKN